MTAHFRPAPEKRGNTSAGRGGIALLVTNDINPRLLDDDVPEVNEDPAQGLSLVAPRGMYTRSWCLVYCVFLVVMTCCFPRVMSLCFPH